MLDFTTSMKSVGVDPYDCIAFEKVLPGIKGIIAAGMQAYGVYDRYSSHEKEKIRKLSGCYIYDFSELM